jgi:prevent-host-death family protein
MVTHIGKRSQMMVSIVNVHQAKTHLSKLLERAHEGEEIILAKAGKPYARLLPLEDSKPREPGIANGRIDDSFFDSLPEEELEPWHQ